MSTTQAILDPTALMTGAGEHRIGERPAPVGSRTDILCLALFQAPTLAAFILAVIGVEGVEGPHVDTGAWVDLYGFEYLIYCACAAGLGLVGGLMAVTRAWSRRHNPLGRGRFHVALGTTAIFLGGVVGMWLQAGAA